MENVERSAARSLGELSLTLITVPSVITVREVSCDAGFPLAAPIGLMG